MDLIKVETHYYLCHIIILSLVILCQEKSFDNNRQMKILDRVQFFTFINVLSKS